MGLTSIKTHHVEPVIVHYLICLEQDLGTVRRPTRIISGRGDLSLQSRTAQRRYYEQATAVGLRSIRNILTIGRPIWLPVVTWPLSYLQGIATAYLLHPDVEFATPIGT